MCVGLQYLGGTDGIPLDLIAQETRIRHNISYTGWSSRLLVHVVVTGGCSINPRSGAFEAARLQNRDTYINRLFLEDPTHKGLHFRPNRLAGAELRAEYTRRPV